MCVDASGQTPCLRATAIFSASWPPRWPCPDERRGRRRALPARRRRRDELGRLRRRRRRCRRAHRRGRRSRFGRRVSLPFADDSVAGAYVDHVLEYLDLADGARLVQELRRVLVRGGRARIVTEDLGRILDQHASADAWVAGGWYENGYDWNQQRCRMLNRAFREAGRRWLYDATEIARVGAVMGLRDPRRCRPGESGDSAAGQPRSAERDRPDRRAREAAAPGARRRSSSASAPARATARSRWSACWCRCTARPI